MLKIPDFNRYYRVPSTKIYIRIDTESYTIYSNIQFVTSTFVTSREGLLLHGGKPAHIPIGLGKITIPQTSAFLQTLQFFILCSPARLDQTLCIIGSRRLLHNDKYCEQTDARYGAHGWKEIQTLSDLRVENASESSGAVHPVTNKPMDNRLKVCGDKD
ncbi:hypothetical protein BDV41DRAFT_332077 [Aspergillus transmontanensis]|uniref:Uncharacterized protein n=1 Tax=Aspergillus transmontanensis TaxID=1034304 RepID=A0A5N6WDD1_9EURO|nr:hypothetical protein BDV41DRAFT_332077 [Aspergillus transmontanensis]